MDRIEIEERVKNFLIEELEIEEENIFPDAKLKDDMGIDSLDFVDIVVIVEKNFGFKIKAEEMVGVAVRITPPGQRMAKRLHRILQSKRLWQTAGFQPAHPA